MTGREVKTATPAHGPKRTYRDLCYLAALGGKADISDCRTNRALASWLKCLKCDFEVRVYFDIPNELNSRSIAAE